MVEALRDQVDNEKKINSELTRIKFQVESELLQNLAVERNRLNMTIEMLNKQYQDFQFQFKQVGIIEVGGIYGVFFFYFNIKNT